MAGIHHRIGIKGFSENIYMALTTNSGIASWWTTDTTGAGEVGSVLKPRFNGQGPDFLIAELELNKVVRWKHAGPAPESWIGTEVLFELHEAEDQTFVRFTHSNWSEPSGFMAHCSMKWAVFLLSLKDVMENGSGQPFPDDIQIDH